MLTSAMHGYFAGWFLQCFIPVYKYSLLFFHSIKQKALNKIITILINHTICLLLVMHVAS